MFVNRQYKDSVFSLLFSDPDVLRRLYCAIEGVELPPDTPVVINTLENVLFMGLVNDISFVIGGKLVVLVEHQSSINPNMALRFLMYLAEIYKRMNDAKSVHAGKALRLPKPEFIVLYNGVEPYPDEQIVRLSEAFEKAAALGLPEKEIPSLELTVRVLNINEGRNADIAKRCRELAGYSAFVAKARELRPPDGSTMEERELSMKAAVRFCVEFGILTEFLKKYAGEVVGMQITDWNLEDAKAVWREEAREECREETARNALAEGLPLQTVQKITGLDMEALKSLAAQPRE